MLEIFKDKQTNLEFKLDIKGNSFKPDVSFCISLYDNVHLKFKGVVENNKAIINVPPLNDVLINFPQEVVNVYLNVVADGVLFSPWDGQATIENSLMVGVTDIQSEQIDKKKTVTVESSLVHKPNTIKFI